MPYAQILYKLCSKCNQFKAACTQNFAPNGSANSGLKLMCRVCERDGKPYTPPPKITPKEQARLNRLKVIEHYSNGTNACVCCRESHTEFLALDHINGGGCAERKELGILTSTRFYQWLIENQFPVGYRILCHNCNSSKGWYGFCPHRNLPEDKLT